MLSFTSAIPGKPSRNANTVICFSSLDCQPYRTNEKQEHRARNKPLKDGIHFQNHSHVHAMCFPLFPFFVSFSVLFFFLFIVSFCFSLLSVLVVARIPDTRVNESSRVEYLRLHAYLASSMCPFLLQKCQSLLEQTRARRQHQCQGTHRGPYHSFTLFI